MIYSDLVVRVVVLIIEEIKLGFVKEVVHVVLYIVGNEEQRLGKCFLSCV